MAKSGLKFKYFLIVGGIFLIPFLFFIVSWIAEYRPEPREVLFSDPMPDRLPDTVKLVSWNIGYAGLGAEMDFFYDGGSKVRGSRKQGEVNLEAIVGILKKIDADIILLQEVDVDSHRSYGADQAEYIGSQFVDYNSVMGLMYKVWFVPIPLRSPIGRVKSGVMTLSRYKPYDVTRVDYPSKHPFPQRLFNLKRGLLSSRFVTSRGDTLMVNNIHNTAYDQGGMREAETGFLREMIQMEASRGVKIITGGDWNQYPPRYTPSKEELENKYWVPEAIKGEMFNSFADFAYGESVPTLRFLDRPYRASDASTVTDCFLLTRGVRVVSVETLDLGFVNSDHNPVVITVTY